MRRLVAPAGDAEAAWAALRIALRERLSPDDVVWDDGVRPAGLFDAAARGDDVARDAPAAGDDANGSADAPRREPSLPAWFAPLARTAALHADDDRMTRLHQLGGQLVASRAAWADTLDARRLDVERMAREVRREIHKMHAFVRFRVLRDGDDERRIAWFEPKHRVLRAATPFFVKRFASMRWAILTPDESVRWDGVALQFGPGAAAADAPAADDREALWLAYYRSIFNPGRVMVQAMRKEMPVRFWKNLPEARQISGLLADAPARRARMIETTGDATRRMPRAPVGAGTGTGDDASTGEPHGPERLASLARQIRHCSACDLAEHATQVVFGHGSTDAALMIVGEQPGDREDLVGRPFVGPAGAMLDEAIATLGWPREKLWLTNAVKHFKHEVRGRRRIHKTPAQREVDACRQWLQAEIAAVRPAAIVALGSTALASLGLHDVRIGDVAGRWLDGPGGIPVLAAYHPAAVLRAGGAAAPDAPAWIESLREAGAVFAGGKVRRDDPAPRDCATAPPAAPPGDAL